MDPRESRAGSGVDVVLLVSEVPTVLLLSSLLKRKRSYIKVGHTLAIDTGMTRTATCFRPLCSALLY